MDERSRVLVRIDAASDAQIAEWADLLKERLFDCHFDTPRVEFKRQVSNAYLKLPQYRDEICRALGAESEYSRGLRHAKWTFRLSWFIALLSLASLIVSLCACQS